MTTTGSICERIAGEYREMPGLSLTAAQAGRLFGLTSDQCLLALETLVAQGRLWRMDDGRYCAAGEGDGTWRVGPPRRWRAA